ncbi:MAG: dihydropteroate synthase, partial [Thermoplasmata archaeon]
EIFKHYGLYAGSESKVTEAIFKKLDNRQCTSSIMGILNATPDSFYSGSIVKENDSKILKMIEEKPDIIDIGGESTRPGSLPVEPEKEIERILPIIKTVRDHTDIPVSIDTRHYQVINALLKYDINYINDISGFKDEKMIQIAQNTDLKCIVMHMRGDPQNMQKYTSYNDIIEEVAAFLQSRSMELTDRGIKEERIILDPGIGFSKDFSGNLEILRNLGSFYLGFPLLVGTSRKTFIGHITGKNPENRLPGTIATSIYLAQNKTDIIRVHDVSENRDAIMTYNALIGK